MVEVAFTIQSLRFNPNLLGGGFMLLIVLAFRCKFWLFYLSMCLVPNVARVQSWLPLRFALTLTQNAPLIYTGYCRFTLNLTEVVAVIFSSQS